jgi:hypothetical protein
VQTSAFVLGERSAGLAVTKCKKQYDPRPSHEMTLTTFSCWFVLVRGSIVSVKISLKKREVATLLHGVLNCNFHKVNFETAITEFSHLKQYNWQTGILTGQDN